MLPSNLLMVSETVEDCANDTIFEYGITDCWTIGVYFNFLSQFFDWKWSLCSKNESEKCFIDFVKCRIGGSYEYFINSGCTLSV